MTALAVFLSTLFGDFAWTRYIQSVAEKQRLAACFWSASIIGVGGVTIVAVAESAVNIVWACLGAAVGTYLAFWWDA